MLTHHTHRTYPGTDRHPDITTTTHRQRHANHNRICKPIAEGNHYRNACADLDLDPHPSSNGQRYAIAASINFNSNGDNVANRGHPGAESRRSGWNRAG